MVENIHFSLILFYFGEILTIFRCKNNQRKDWQYLCLLGPREDALWPTSQCILSTVYVYHLNVYLQQHSGEHIYDNIMTAGWRETFMSYLSIIYNTVFALRGDENYPYNRARKDGYMTDIYANPYPV